MKNLLLTLTLIFAGAFSAFAQTEAYVGAQFQRSNPDVQQTNFKYDQTTDAVGVNASLTNYFGKGQNVGLTGEVAATFNNTEFDTQNYTGQGGVTLKSRKYKVQPFVRALGGVAVNRSQNELNSNYKTGTGFVYTLGGGVDWKNWRIFQADFQRQRIYGENVNYFRLGTGVRW